MDSTPYLAKAHVSSSVAVERRETEEKARKPVLRGLEDDSDWLLEFPALFSLPGSSSQPS